MSVNNEKWNPWHGCTKISPGCMHCYVYRIDERHGNGERARECKKTADFSLPVKRARNGQYKLRPGSIVFTCFTSDFLLNDADPWRDDCWRYIKERKDCYFYFFTKRIERFMECVPSNWGDGYENVIVGCTVENQDRADFRLKIFKSLPIKHKSIIVAPILECIDLRPYLDDTVEEVTVSGESGIDARACDYDWVTDIRAQCIEKNVPFFFHQTGSHFMKNGKLYNVPRRSQGIQARKAKLDFRMKGQLPETANYDLNPDLDENQLTMPEF